MFLSVCLICGLIALEDHHLAIEMYCEDPDIMHHIILCNSVGLELVLDIQYHQDSLYVRYPLHLDGLQ